MSALAISGIVCLVLIVGALGGALLRRLLPDRHLDQHAKDIVRLGAGLLATIVGLVLGLLISSAKGNFDTQRDEVRRLTASAIMLDKTLEEYGPETRPTRAELRMAVADFIDQQWGLAKAPSPSRPYLPTATAQDMYRRVVGLAPATDPQRFYKAQAMEIANSMLQQRLVLYEQAGGRMPTLLVVILAAWLFVLFMSFSLFSPLNPTALGAVAIIALSAAAAFFLIFEMFHPFSGLMQIDSEPLKRALRALPP